MRRYFGYIGLYLSYTKILFLTKSKGIENHWKVKPLKIHLPQLLILTSVTTCVTDHGNNLHLVVKVPPPFLDSKNRYLHLFLFFISGSVNHLLLVVNSSMNFLIYCCMAKRFRKALLDVFRSWRCHWSGGSILQCWMPFDDLSKMDVNRYNWKSTFFLLSVQSILWGLYKGWNKP